MIYAIQGFQHNIEDTMEGLVGIKLKLKNIFKFIQFLHEITTNFQLMEGCYTLSIFVIWPFYLILLLSK